VFDGQQNYSKRKKYWTLTLKQNIVYTPKKKFYISYSLSARSKADLWWRKKKRLGLPVWLGKNELYCIEFFLISMVMV